MSYICKERQWNIYKDVNKGNGDVIERQWDIYKDVNKGNELYKDVSKGNEIYTK